MFTFHSYRSWLPDRPQGYVRKGEGILQPDPKMAKHYNEAASHPPMDFDSKKQDILVQAAKEVCKEKNWRLHQVCVVPTHIHALVSWKGFTDWKDVSNTLKRRLGSALSKALNEKGPWFSRGGSRKRVKDRNHFDNLMNVYLPKHGHSSWREDAEPRGYSSRGYDQSKSDVTHPS